MSHAASYTDIQASIVMGGVFIACPTVDAEAAPDRARRWNCGNRPRDSTSGPRSLSTMSEADTTPTKRPFSTTGTPEISCLVSNAARSRKLISGGTVSGGLLITSRTLIGSTSSMQAEETCENSIATRRSEGIGGGHDPRT
jgi:hypothetical protein